MAKAKRVLEGLLDKGGLTPSELSTIARTLITLNDRESEEAAANDKQKGDASVLVDQMDDAEREVLRKRFDQQDAFYNHVRQRLGQPVKPSEWSRPFVDRFDYLTAVINRRDEQFLRLVNDFVLEHPSLATAMDNDRTGEMERSVAAHLIRLLDQVGLYNKFSERVEQQLVVGDPDGSIDVRYRDEIARHLSTAARATAHHHRAARGELTSDQLTRGAAAGRDQEVPWRVSKELNP